MLSNQDLHALFHDLRSPIGGIRALTSLFIEGDYGQLSPDGLRAMQIMQKTAEEALAMIEQRSLTIEK